VQDEGGRGQEAKGQAAGGAGQRPGSAEPTGNNLAARTAGSSSTVVVAAVEVVVEVAHTCAVRLALFFLHQVVGVEVKRGEGVFVVLELEPRGGACLSPRFPFCLFGWSHLHLCPACSAHPREPAFFRPSRPTSRFSLLPAAAAAPGRVSSLHGFVRIIASSRWIGGVPALSSSVRIVPPWVWWRRVVFRLSFFGRTLRRSGLLLDATAWWRACPPGTTFSTPRPPPAPVARRRQVCFQLFSLMRWD